MNRLGYAAGVTMMALTAAAIGYLCGRSDVFGGRAVGAVAGQPRGVPADPSYKQGHALRIFLKGENVSDVLARGSVVCVIDPGDLEKRGWEELASVGRIQVKGLAGHEDGEPEYRSLYMRRELLRGEEVLANLVLRKVPSADEPEWVQVHVMVRRR